MVVVVVVVVDVTPSSHSKLRIRTVPFPSCPPRMGRKSFEMFEYVFEYGLEKTGQGKSLSEKIVSSLIFPNE